VTSFQLALGSHKNNGKVHLKLTSYVNFLFPQQKYVPATMPNVVVTCQLQQNAQNGVKRQMAYAFTAAVNEQRKTKRLN